MEHFSTIQGEGYHTGRAAYFIRLSGCDVGCHWCDVKESWEMTSDQLLLYRDILQEVGRSATKYVVITGGEPLMYDCTYLCESLIVNNYQLGLETSGAYPLSGNWHWICLSPKKNKPPLREVYAQANELKMIIYNRHDLEWAEEHAKMVNNNCHLYLQAEWSRRAKIYPLIIEYIKQNPQWKISVQSHKYLDIP